MDRKASQINEISYLRWGLIIAVFSAMGTYLGVGVSYWAWQSPKAPIAESQKLVNESASTVPRPSTTPNTLPSPVPSITPSPTPSATPKNKNPASTTVALSEPDSYMVVGDDGLCYESDENGNVFLDDNGAGIEVDCSDY